MMVFYLSAGEDASEGTAERHPLVKRIAQWPSSNSKKMIESKLSVI
jgi:hypothetical protein